MAIIFTPFELPHIKRDIFPIGKDAVLLMTLV